jgi:hypothetical protein
MKSIYASLSTVFLISGLLFSPCAIAAPAAAAESGITVNAQDLYQAFKRDATAARKKYYDKIIVVTGILDTVGKVTGGEAMTIERSTVCRVQRKSSELEDIKQAIKDERDRMEKARSWAREYDRDRRKNIVRRTDTRDNGYEKKHKQGIFNEYDESINPNGPRDENLLIEISVTGKCRGIRSGKVFVDKCTDLSFTTRPGNRLELLEKKK